MVNGSRTVGVAAVALSAFAMWLGLPAHALSATRDLSRSLHVFEHPWCGTELPSQEPPGSGRGSLSACPLQGPCDDPAIRDATTVDAINLRTIVHVIRRGDGTGGVTQARVDSILSRMNADFAANHVGIQLDLIATRFHDNDSVACVPTCTDVLTCISQGRQFIEYTKSLYAEEPSTRLNLYLQCWPESPYGYAYGIGHFPWRETRLEYPGGLWLNTSIDTIADGLHVPTHEAGHTLGLWHTSHGISEVGCSSPCYEPASGFEGDTRGDYASDTPPTPHNAQCQPPGGSDCLSNPFGRTQFENHMGSSLACASLFTPQQARRMQCWIRDRLASWYSTPIAPCERPVEAGAVGVWHLNEASGDTAHDSSPHRRDGVIEAGTPRGTSHCGSACLVLNDPAHGARLPGEVVSGLAAGTFECSFQWDGTEPAPGGAWIFDQSISPGASNLGAVLMGDHRVHFHVAGLPRVTSITTIRPRRWYRLACTWDGTSTRIDLDDLLDAEVAGAAIPVVSSAPLVIGRSGGTASEPGAFTGSIDEIRAQSSAPTASAPPTPEERSSTTLTVAPNPASRIVVISYAMATPGPARIDVFDLGGRHVATLAEGWRNEGSHRIRWEGRNRSGARVAPGAYIARLSAAGVRRDQKFVWLP